MKREEEIIEAGIDYTMQHSPCCIGGDNFYKQVKQFNRNRIFEAGAQWADDNPKLPWIKITEKIPPHQEPIIIAMKNKNKEDGIWLYDLCKFFGGDYTDNNNWEDKVNWEIPIYWMPIPNLPKQ